MKYDPTGYKTLNLSVAAAVAVDAVVVVADPVLGRARLAVVEDAVRAKRPIERATLSRSKTSPPGSGFQSNKF